MLLVWLIGLTLGVAAGAATAALLMPRAEAESSRESIAGQFRNG